MNLMNDVDLNKIEQMAAGCTLCELCKGRNQPVFARGYTNADVIVCGMCPGPDENREGIPFVGAAGKILDSILNQMMYRAYITNLVKCYVQPGTSLDPKWMNTCLPYFVIQMHLIKPKVVIALGKDVSNFLLARDEKIGALRKNTYNYMGSKLICTYHPSYLARGGGEKHKDFQKVVGDFNTAMLYI